MNDEHKIAHLGFIQNVITRKENNCFLLKVWMVITNVAIIAIAIAVNNEIALWAFILISIFTTIIFAYFDAYNLRIARQYRELYNDLRESETTRSECYTDLDSYKSREIEKFDMNASMYKIESCSLVNLCKSMINCFYTPLILLLIAMLVGACFYSSPEKKFSIPSPKVDNASPIFQGFTTNNEQIIKQSYKDAKEYVFDSKNTILTLSAIVVGGITIVLPIVLISINTKLFDKKVEHARKKIKKELALMKKSQERDMNFIYLQAKALVSENTDEKLKFFNKMIELNPFEYMPYIYKANINLKIKRRAEAFIGYECATKYAKKGLLNRKFTLEDVAESCALHGLAFYRDAQYDRAINKYTESLSVYEDFLSKYYTTRGVYNLPTVLVDQAHCYILLGKIDEAKKGYIKAKKISDKSGSFPHLRTYCVSSSILYILEKNYANALTEIDKVIKYHPKSNSLHFLKGYILYRQKKYEESIGYFRETIKLSFSHWLPYYYLALTMIKTAPFKNEQIVFNLNEALSLLEHSDIHGLVQRIERLRDYYA